MGQNAEREEDVSFSLPIKMVSQGVFIKNPAKVINFTTYIETLTNMSWALVIVFLVLVPLSISLVSQFGQENDNISIGSSYELVWATLVMMGTPVKPSKMSIRVIFGR